MGPGSFLVDSEQKPSHPGWNLPEHQPTDSTRLEGKQRRENFMLYYRFVSILISFFLSFLGQHCNRDCLIGQLQCFGAHNFLNYPKSRMS